MSANQTVAAGTSSEFVDTTTDCAICLFPLSAEETIKLGCGHLWHLRCIKEQLEHAAPNPGRRLLFSGCRCAKCSVFCDHPLLNAHVSRSTAVLREQVDELIKAQIRVDGLDNHPLVLSPNGEFSGDAIALGRALYAFYQCTVCKQAYFGGTIACAEGDGGDDLLPSDDRFCPTCTPHSSTVCTDSTHIAFHIWKCRYCCASATHVCNGTTHFCDGCHARYSEFLRRTDNTGVLAAIECPGIGECTSPFREGQVAHNNGSSHKNEQVFMCTMCNTDPGGRAARAAAEHASLNMVFNPNGAEGLRGWTQLLDKEWSTEESEIGYARSNTNFVSSFNWCVMAQVIDLRHFLTQPSNAALEVSARYMGRTDCPSEFRFEGTLYSANVEELAHFRSDALIAPSDFWEPVTHVFEPTENAAFAVVTIYGKDRRFWVGNYGSKATDINVRVLFDRSTASEPELVIPGALDNVRAVSSREIRSVMDAVREKVWSSPFQYFYHTTYLSDENDLPNIMLHEEWSDEDN